MPVLVVDTVNTVFDASIAARRGRGRADDDSADIVEIDRNAVREQARGSAGGAERITAGRADAGAVGAGDTVVPPNTPLKLAVVLTASLFAPMVAAS